MSFHDETRPRRPVTGLLHEELLVHVSWAFTFLFMHYVAWGVMVLGFWSESSPYSRYVA